MQKCHPSDRPLKLMSDYRDIVNATIDRAIADSITSRNSLSKAVYGELREQYPIPSYFHNGAINKAVAIVKNYRKSLRKKKNVRKPHVVRPFLSTYFGFRIVDGVLLVPVAKP